MDIGSLTVLFEDPFWIGVFVRLIPVGFVNNNWKCDTTTDPEVFWAKP